MGSLCQKLKVSWLRAFLRCMSQTSLGRDNNSRRCSPIGHNHIFCAQSEANIHLTVWKWSGESRYPGALPPLLDFSPDQTDCPWVSEDGTKQTLLLTPVPLRINQSKSKTLINLQITGKPIQRVKPPYNSTWPYRPKHKSCTHTCSMASRGLDTSLKEN